MVGTLAHGDDALFASRPRISCRWATGITQQG
jgi:hypothetical protein